MKPSEIYPVSLELQTTLLCMNMMTAIMVRISVLYIHTYIHKLYLSSDFSVAYIASISDPN